MINISDVAADKIKEIMKVEGLPNHGLRIVAGGGGCCGGSQYEIMLDEKAGTGDTVIEKNGAKLYVDAKTAKALEGLAGTRALTKVDPNDLPDKKDGKTRKGNSTRL